MANLLTHAYFALRLMDNHELTVDEEDHLILGCILPDISLTGWIHYRNTHIKGHEFFEYVGTRLNKFTALGIILHGERPLGLDHYFHGWQNFIDEHTPKVRKIAEKYKSSIGKIDKMTIHHLIEFSADNIIAKNNPWLVTRVTKALRNSRIHPSITAFSSFHSLEEKHNRKILSIVTSKHLNKFISNFDDIETVAHSWMHLRFFLQLSEGKALPISKKLKKLTQFSFYNLKRKINDKDLTSLFKELNFYLEEKLMKLLDQAEQEIKPVKDEYCSKIYN